MSLEEWRTIFSGFTLISVFFVVLNYWFSRTKAKNDAIESKDKEICEQAILSLERAYGSLTHGKVDYALPEGNRLSWLTSSRQIIKFKQLKAMLNTDLYKLICSEHEEHWKHEFYLSLKSEQLILPEYFTSNNIHLKSALVIMNFMQWSPSVVDPLDSIDGSEIVNDNYTLKGLHGLMSCISQSKPEDYQ